MMYVDIPEKMNPGVSSYRTQSLCNVVSVVMHSN